MLAAQPIPSQSCHMKEILCMAPVPAEIAEEVAGTEPVTSAGMHHVCCLSDLEQEEDSTALLVDSAQHAHHRSVRRVVAERCSPDLQSTAVDRWGCQPDTLARLGPAPLAYPAGILANCASARCPQAASFLRGKLAGPHTRAVLQVQDTEAQPTATSPIPTPSAANQPS